MSAEQGVVRLSVSVDVLRVPRLFNETRPLGVGDLWPVEMDVSLDQGSVGQWKRPELNVGGVVSMQDWRPSSSDKTREVVGKHRGQGTLRKGIRDEMITTEK